MTQVIPTYKGPLHIFTYNYIFHAPASNKVLLPVYIKKAMRKKKKGTYPIYILFSRRCGNIHFHS